jgi:anti-sigma factor RsiW
MRCDEFVELVTAYLENELDQTTAQRFVEHLALCEGCDRYLDQIRRTIDELGHLPEERLSPQARSDLLGAFRDWYAK